MPIRAALVALIVLMMVVKAHAEVGRGELPRNDGSIIRQIHAPSLATIGEDVVRFSRTPSLGGRAIIVELHAGRTYAKGAITFFFGHPSIGKWKKAGSLHLEMSLDEFARISREIDTLMSKEEPVISPDANGDIIVCTDGSNLTTERHNYGVTKWLTGRSCGSEHPNDAIADLLAAVVRQEFQRFGFH